MNRLSKNTTTWLFAACLTAVALPLLASVTIDASFAHLYPDPWWKSWWGRMAIGVGIAVIAAGALAFTVATAGTGGAMLGAAGSWITGVGSMVGMAAGYGSGAAAAGLAILGGGTLAAGGFGIAGGAFVVAALTGVATGVVTDLAVSQIGDMIAKEPYKRYEFIKVPLLEKRGSQNVRALVSELRELEEKLNKKDITPQQFSKETQRVSSKLKDMLANACKDLGNDKDKLYNAINAAILFFNNGDYKKTKRCLEKVYPHTRNSSFVSYLYALNELAENNIRKLSSSSILQSI